jgi:hypothetical protein
MLIAYLILLIVVFALVIFYGVKLSNNIYHPTLLVFFWVIYLATMLTVGNLIATAFFYNVLRNKKGLPGDQGRIGDKGDKGVTGACDIQCDSKVCTLTILKAINKYYSSLIQTALNNRMIGSDDLEIKNHVISDKLRTICSSDAYKQVTQIKSVDTVNKYIIDIYQKWIKILIDADKTDDKKQIREYLETEGMEEKPELSGSPFKEIEKYDVYYWGGDRIFHPRVIQICSNPDIYKGVTDSPKPLLKGIKTNFYSTIINSNRYGGGHFSAFRVEPYFFDNNVYYSLGDIITNTKNFNQGNKFLERYLLEKEGKITLGGNAISNTPSTPTLLISGSDRYVRPPLDWQLIWRSKTNRNPVVAIWKPKDIVDRTLNVTFKACGVLVLARQRNNYWTSPRRIYGYNTPERQPIRLVSSELLEEITTQTPIKQVWNDRGSRSPDDTSVWLTTDKDYLQNHNQPIAVIGYNYPRFITFNKIKRSSFLPPNMEPLQFESDATDKDELGTGYHGVPHMSPEYSIFSFLNMPLETQLTNLANSHKIYLKHSGINSLNSYMIRKHFPNQEKLENVLAVKRTGENVDDSTPNNNNNTNTIWEIVCIDSNFNPTNDCTNGRYFIKSKPRNLYLRAQINNTSTGPDKLTINQLPSRDNRQIFNELIKEFIWFNPRPATGTPLQQSNNDKTYKQSTK